MESIEKLVDRLAVLRAEIKELEKEEDFIKDSLIKTQQERIEGKTFVAMIKEVPTSRLDTKGVKEEMGDDWYRDHSVTTVSVRVTVAPKAKG